MSAVQPSAVDDGVAIRYYAGFAARSGAFVADALIAVGSVLPGLLILVLSPTVQQACTVDGRSTQCSVPSSGWLKVAMTVIVIGFCVQLAWYCRRVAGGQSVGQRAAGVLVVDELTVGAVGPWRIFARQFAGLVSTVVFGLGHLWMLWDQRSQTWHDKLAGTIVIKA